MEIHKASQNEIQSVVSLALLLWPNHTDEELAEEFAPALADAHSAVFLAQERGEAVGFAQCGLRRDYVEGADTSPVGYLEGIYVREAARGAGVATALLYACEEWARGQGCSEFASDCTLDNAASERFHKRLGFAEAGRIICFIKPL